MLDNVHSQQININKLDSGYKHPTNADAINFNNFSLTSSSDFLHQVEKPIRKATNEQLSKLDNSSLFQSVSAQGIAGSEGVRGSQGPEGPYQSETQAALNGINRIGAIPNARVNEYGGAVFEHSDGSFSLSPIRTDGSPTAVIIDELTVQVPEGANISAIFHNHPRDATLPTNEVDWTAYEFSDTGRGQGDIPTAESTGVNLYIRVYDGAVRKYDSSDNTNQWIRHSPNSRNIQ